MLLLLLASNYNVEASYRFGQLLFCSVLREKGKRTTTSALFIRVQMLAEHEDRRTELDDERAKI